MITPFRPMLSTQAELSTLKYPLIASYKIDGLRAVVSNGQFISRSGKSFPNRFLQAWAASHPELEGTDGELVVGNPNDPDTFRRSQSYIMSDDRRDYPFTFYVFDLVNKPSAPYFMRWKFLHDLVPHTGYVELHRQVSVDTPTALDHLEETALAEGYEGLMLRSPHELYKHGRSTNRDQALLKLKRHADLEAEVIGFKERQRNDNVPYRNEIGRTMRSSARAGKSGLGTLGALTVRGLPSSAYPDVTFSVDAGLDDAYRAELWSDRDALAGRIARVRYFPLGSKDAPRHPVFAGWRDGIDMDG